MYGTVLEADAYFNEKLENEVWLVTDPDRKLRALKESTRLINRLNFVGTKADPDQEDEFPRGTSTTVPLEIKHATYECAYALLDDVNVEFEQHIQNQDQLTFDQLRSKHNREIVLTHVAHNIPSSVAWSLLIPFLRDKTSFELYRSG